MSAIHYQRDPAEFMKELSRELRGAMEDGVRHWHGKFMPGHFTIQGGKRYGYQLRAGEDEPRQVIGRRGRLIGNQKYYWRKIRTGHGNVPLIYSGTSRDAARENIRFAVRKSGDGTIKAAAVMSLPDHFYKYRKDTKNGRIIDKVKELLATVPAEQEELMDVISKSLHRRADAIRPESRNVTI